MDIGYVKQPYPDDDGIGCGMGWLIGIVIGIIFWGTIIILLLRR